MKTYWDHTEEERAQLTKEEVESLLPLELMEQGIVRPPPLELEPEEHPPLDRKSFFCVTYEGGRWGRESFDLLFVTFEDAKALLDLKPAAISLNVGESSAVQIRDPKIETIELPSHEDVMAMKGAYEDYEAAKSRNRKARERHAEQTEEVERVCKPVWDDWRRCRERKAYLDRVRATFDDYYELSGSSDVARRFLGKAYAADDIDDALGTTSEPEPTVCA